MKTLREIVETSPQLRAIAMHTAPGDAEPEPLGPDLWDWQSIRRVLVIRLRSIGDTVLTTPTLSALKRFLPQARVDILLEDWVAPVLEGFPDVDEVLTMPRGTAADRIRAGMMLRRRRYDVVYNLHGGTTATLLTRATGAPHRVGFAHYQYGRLHNHLAPPALELWHRDKAHSVEQQLALPGWTGVPVTDRPPSHLAVTDQAMTSVQAKLDAAAAGAEESLAVIHPAAAFETKQWATEKFARVAEDLTARGLTVIVITAPEEGKLIEELQQNAAASIKGLNDLSLPEVTALCSRARLFVGNDSGIAHIAAAVNTPSVVIFGSSNVVHWRPWTRAAAEVVLEEMPCQPCPGYYCAEFEKPECIRRVPVERVAAAIDRVLRDAH